MAKTVRYDGDTLGHVEMSLYECDECSRQITSKGSYAEDAEGFKLFVCAFCARKLAQDVPSHPRAGLVFA